MTVLRAQRRVIEINGKPASVLGIGQPDGTFGITTAVGRQFRVRVENQLDRPTLIHLHSHLLYHLDADMFRTFQYV